MAKAKNGAPPAKQSGSHQPTPRDEQLAELLELDPDKLAQLYTRALVRGGRGRWSMRDATDLVRMLVHEHGRKLGMDCLFVEPPPPPPAKADAIPPSEELRTSQRQLEERRRAMPELVPASGPDEPALQRKPRTREERQAQLEAQRRVRDRAAQQHVEPYVMTTAPAPSD